VRAPHLLTIALLIGACSPIRGCVESQFTLDADSRLPKWIAVPAGVSRNELTVRIRYYVPPFSVDNTEIELLGKNGATLFKTTGEHCWHPVMEAKKNKYGGFDPGSEPHYVYIRANGALEVVEHVRGPTFRITDDPMLIKQASEATRCNKG
jgi:hypothetical protein